MDQRHSKPKSKLKDTDKKATLQSVTAENSREQNNSHPTLLDFSEDSFSQLTEEILNYSAHSESESNKRTFSNSLSISSASGNSCLVEDVIATPRDSSSSTSSSSVVNSQSLSGLLEDNVYFQLTRKNTVAASAKIAGQAESVSSDSSSSVENFECANLDDSCNVNDIALKELENQLFSVCFCSVENE